MNCPECTAAAAKPWAAFRRDCKGCKARAISRGQDFARCRSAGHTDYEYRALLARAGVTHDQVKAAAAADAMTQQGSQQA